MRAAENPVPNASAMPEFTKRSVLFLQGPSSPFWPELARAFEAAGHATHRIHCNMGDFVFWLRPGGTWR